MDDRCQGIWLVGYVLLMLEKMKYNIILASNSPRRRELLAGLDVDYEVRVLKDIDETYPDSLPVADIPTYI